MMGRVHKDGVRMVWYTLHCIVFFVFFGGVNLKAFSRVLRRKTFLKSFIEEKVYFEDGGKVLMIMIVIQNDRMRCQQLVQTYGKVVACCAVQKQASRPLPGLRIS